MKELYYIRGSKTNQEEVKQALLDKGGILETRFSFNDGNGLYYIDKDSKIAYVVNADNAVTRLLKEYGTKLQPTKPKETFEPFDRVLVRCGNEKNWGIDIFMAISYGKYMECIGATYSECHKYESWMDKYVDTDVSFEEFKKD